MASLTVRQLDERLKKRLRLRAAHNGRSVEDEVRTILREADLREERVGATTGKAAVYRTSFLACQFADTDFSRAKIGEINIVKFDRSKIIAEPEVMERLAPGAPPAAPGPGEPGGPRKTDSTPPRR